MFYQGLLMSFGLCVAFELKCPEPGQWSTRSRLLCPNPSLYYCLLFIDRNTQFYTENCSRVDFEAPGKRIVIRGNFDSSPCSSGTYQPSFIKYWTNVSSDCLYLASNCTEEGQVVSRNDPYRESDTTCRCDYTRGYEYVVRPKNPCMCISSQEDCSCYKKICATVNLTLSRDYKCKEQTINHVQEVCETLSMTRAEHVKIVFPPFPHFVQTDPKEKGYNRHIAALFVLVAIFIFVGIILLLYCVGIQMDICLDEYRKVYFISKLDEEIECIEGEIHTLSCRVSRKNILVIWTKDGQTLQETSHLKITQDGEYHCLEIQDLTLADTGKYAIHFDDRTRTNCTDLKVKTPFASNLSVSSTCIEGNTLELYCRTIFGNHKANWKKNGDEIKTSDRIFIGEETEDHKLTINDARCSDSGTYTIYYGKARRSLLVQIQAFIKPALSEIITIENLDATLTFDVENTAESRNLSVQLLKDGVEISDSSVTVERGDGVYMVKFTDTKLSHTGMYKIKIGNKYESEAYIDVKPWPEEMKRMSSDDRNEFLNVARSGGISRRYDIRVMIVGKKGAGKTSLLNRLINQPLDNIQSTNCLNIVKKKCQISLKTGQWLFSDNKSGTKSTTEKLADCSFSDFAGQTEFYATHQMFLTSNAIYILAVDMSEDFTAKTNDNMLEKEWEHAGEYIHFWLDNIHCYARADDIIEAQSIKEELFPPVIIVGTGIDKIDI